MNTVDSHHHFWNMSKFDYEWMPQSPNVLAQNYMPEDMEPLLLESGISRTVIVQAHQSVEETEFLLDIADENDFVAGVVGWVDLTDSYPNHPSPVGYVLDRLMKRPKFKGVRHLVHDELKDDWLTKEDVISGLKQLVFRGLPYDVLARPVHLKYIPILAEKVSGLRMVIDHIAKPLIAEHVMEPWASEIAEVAAIPGIYCKVSGMVTEANHQNWTVDDLKPYVQHVIDVFGIDRLMWGSDWPVCKLASEYKGVLDATLEAMGPLSEEERSAFLGGNATRFYNL